MKSPDWYLNFFSTLFDAISLIEQIISHLNFHISTTESAKDSSTVWINWDSLIGTFIDRYFFNNIQQQISRAILFPELMCCIMDINSFNIDWFNVHSSSDLSKQKWLGSSIASNWVTHSFLDVTWEKCSPGSMIVYWCRNLF